MKFKSCLTCEYFKDNIVKENFNKETYETKVLEYSSSWCFHTLSNGEMSTHTMIYGGPCGKDMKLWKRKGSLLDEFEIRETD